jgi:hypothetical protein
MRIGVIFLVLVLPVVIGGGVALALSDATIHAFWMARVCFIAAATDALGLALYRLWAGNARVSLRLVIGAIVGAVVIPVIVLALRWVDLREAQNSTKLAAGNLPTPAVPPQARVPQDALMLFLGSTVAWATKMPHTVVEMGSDKMLVLDKDKAGDKLVLRVLKIFDENNKIIARIDDDGFWMASSTRIKRPDPGTLVVLDHGNTEVLRIAFLNPKALSITGIFRHAGQRTVSITPEYLDIGRMRITQATFGENARADIGLGASQRGKKNRDSDE